ncbi:CRISPR system precrRNA processing endoribonuclease RAMP protein Cas6 [Oceanobacter sp. 3_MG-2023]|jgi:hypothetical protein|uniref:CRISPR system precrRNA processing endoribonuclease RAMP protein Cas6 n=1 Tax=Oceanobacter sp. 3_MG-2023 TaxID=3062622 RepID=UPI002733D2EA|nr:CRISPR system precrRNA processing endoribonuclease RAMP protein Cas6 [Oceanobacter sp. 3_MG-2023]MDP2505800.1 CRISPR system precrRNA processing endoribonuclease RAMP protein Cas6 [Oceanobacter sp. 3_MG-2023]
MTEPALTLPPLQYARFRFDVAPTADFKLPDYAGSMLRGAFGHAFRRLSCMTRQPGCSDCPLINTCPYTQVYENSAGQLHTNRYVIEPPQSGYRWLKAGEIFTFHMVLFGYGLAQLPLILLAWQQALERGLGKHNTPARLIAVYCDNDDQPCYRPGDQIGHWQPSQAELPPVPEQVVLQLHTPVYLKHQGKPVRKNSLSAYPLLMALARRYHMLTTSNPSRTASEIDFKRLTALANTIKLDEQVHWQEWTRYSNRQQQTMQLGGLIGQITLSGKLAPVWPLLIAGQWTHLGKHASFGLGQYHCHLPTQQPSPSHNQAIQEATNE